MPELPHLHATQFRRRLHARDILLGTFIKSPGPWSVEIMGIAGFDFVVIDAEHAPFDRTSTELAILAARASGLASIVRTAGSAPEALLAALDDGATGVMVPHVKSPEIARQIVAACRYSAGRGISNAPRAGRYGATSMWEHADRADQEVTVFAMIEDVEAVENIDAILGVSGIDGVFIGRGDLTVAMNDREPGAPRVAHATAKVLKACARASVPACLFATSSAEAQTFKDAGVTAFVVASDQGFMRTAATSAMAQFQSALVLGSQAS
jgi:2-keto-3-deoxy-L-rhamnonate aldolase RhmA